MKEKSHMSLRTKKILAGIGISFGTVFAFLVSFIITFSLYINPISSDITANEAVDDDKVKEESKISEQKQKNDDSAYEKYPEEPKTPAVVVSGQPDTQPEATEPSTPSANNNQEDITMTSVETGQEDNTGTAEVNQPENPEPENDGDDNATFSPETITNTGEDTPEDVEEPIMVIEIED